MAKKEIVKTEGCMKGMKGLYFIGAVVFAALGLASLIQGLLLQWNFGFTYGFFAYLLAFLFFGAGKCLKWKVMGACCPEHMMHH